MTFQCNCIPAILEVTLLFYYIPKGQQIVLIRGKQLETFIKTLLNNEYRKKYSYRMYGIRLLWLLKNVYEQLASIPISPLL